MPASLFYYGPLVKRLRQRPLTPLTWVRFPHGSPKNAPQLRLGSFFGASVRGIEQDGRPQAAKNNPADCFLVRGRWTHGSPKNAPQLRLGSFFWCFRARNRTGRPPAGGKKQSCGLFFSPREMDARVTKKIPRKKLRGIFYCCFPGRQCAGGGASAER